MSYSVYTSDGERHFVFNDQDAIELIERYVGNDMVQCIRECMRDYKNAIDAEKESLEYEIESLEDDYEDQLNDLHREMYSIESASKRLKEEIDKKDPDLDSVRSILVEIIKIVS